MAIQASDLDSDLKVFEQKDGSVDDSVNADSLDHYLHQKQEDSFSGEDSSRVKKFFDYINLHVFLPWIKALTKGFNALKRSVEEEYLKSERVQQKYDPESAEPMSGKAVAEAAAKVMELTDADTIWGAIRRTGSYLELEGSIFWTNSLPVMIMRTVNGDLSEGEIESNTKGWVGRVRLFVKNTDTEKIYFINADEAMKVVMGNLEEPKPIYDPAITKEKVLDSLFPMEEAREDITSQAGSYALPSDDVKIECEIDWGGQTTGRYIYMATPSYLYEPIMYIKDGITSPFLFPDDFADQEMAATYWKAGNIFEAGSSTKATLITTKEQTDRQAISPSRLKELIEAATETKTIYIPVAKLNEKFVISDEMKENGLVVRGNYRSGDYVFCSFTVYDPSGNIVAEPSVPSVPRGEVVDAGLSGWQVGSFVEFHGGSDYGGSAEIQMPVVIRSVSSEKLAALLAEEVSEE